MIVMVVVLCHVCGLVLFLFQSDRAAGLTDSSSSVGGDSDSGGSDIDTAHKVLNEVCASTCQCIICKKTSDLAFPNFDVGYVDVNCDYCLSMLR